jgi:Fe-S oxidoreductase
MSVVVNATIIAIFSMITISSGVFFRTKPSTTAIMVTPKQLYTCFICHRKISKIPYSMKNGRNISVMKLKIEKGYSHANAC